MRWFRKEEETKVEPLQVQEVIPRYIVPENIIAEIRAFPKKEAYSKSKPIIIAFLKTLNRPELLAFQDADQFKDFKEDINEAAWEAYYDEEWKRVWPLGKETYEQRIPDIIRNTFNDYDDLKKQVQGMQKRLDRLAAIMENTEITMSGKTALKM